MGPLERALRIFLKIFQISWRFNRKRWIWPSLS